MDFDGLIAEMPKAELHVHIEGTLEPEMMLDLAARNGIELPYPDVEAVRQAYQFTNLQSFLDIFYQGAAVLRTEDDFADLMAGYLERAIADGVTRAEIFFDPQTHTERGVAIRDRDRRSRSRPAATSPTASTAALILCFLRHLPEDSALATLAAAEPYLDQIIAVGLDSIRDRPSPGKVRPGLRPGQVDGAPGGGPCRGGGAARLRLGRPRLPRGRADRSRRAGRWRTPTSSSVWSKSRCRSRSVPQSNLKLRSSPTSATTRSSGCSTSGSTSRSTPMTPPTSVPTSRDNYRHAASALGLGSRGDHPSGQRTRIVRASRRTTC